MKTRHLRSTLLAAGSAGFVLTSASAAAGVCTPLQVQTTVESHGPHITLAGQAFGQRGAAVVSGDFNGDGYEDSAFSEPGATVASQFKAGRVYVVFGSVNAPAQVITQGGLPGQADIRESFFGTVLDSGDFNADGYDDLVVTSLHSNSVDGPGKYFVIAGGANGLQTQQAASIGGVTIENSPQPVTVADFDRDGFQDIAMGQWWWQGTCPQSQPYGRLVVAYGTGAAEITFDRMTATSQDLNGVQCGGQFASIVDSGAVAGGMRIFAGQPGYDLPGMSATKDVGGYLQFDASNGLQQVDFSHAAHANAHYGVSFAFGDFDGDTRGDYAVGAWGGNTVPGWVRIGFGSGASQILTRSHFGNAPLPFADNFGSRLMAGDFDGDRQQDLIVSEARYPGTPAPDDQGAVLIARGSYRGNLQPVHTEIQVAPAGASTWLTGAMAAIDTDSNGIDEVLIGNHSGEINAEAPPASGFLTRSKFVNLDQCSAESL
jgi:hypothetical protein